MIPSKLSIYGNFHIGNLYVGAAKEQMRKLKRSMKRDANTCPSLNESCSTTHPSPGVVIECWASFSLSEIKITVKGKKEAGEELNEKYKKEKCFCACHVAIGYVQNKRHACYDFTDLDVVYDVVVCKNKNFYSLIENAIPMGFTPYKNGEKVMVIFEPELGEEYIPDINQGCHSIHCRITNIKETHLKFTEDSNGIS